ncbi:alkyl sulfatase C-terminal domain-containing protein [Mycobacterium sp.]|uniref:alkyl sulfatase C-terminal domain-containing protein n=1 Tax=Mycobacterium sp. TaxID=1785 RepID=UPI002BEE1091|nr:alkyl sulfatase C-terminal domain-containing protein [Mycobacterium sp.]HME47032.1 alkyl sulfatase C-terminal domain-containing protein [Mycobacterium sp.]
MLGRLLTCGGERRQQLSLVVVDAEANYRLTLRNGVLVYVKRAADPSTAGATVKLAQQSPTARAGARRGRLTRHRGERLTDTPSRRCTRCFKSPIRTSTSSHPDEVTTL